MGKRNKTIITISAVVITVVTIVIIGTVAIQATPANRVKRQLRLAQKYLNELNYEQAVLAYKEAISIDPKCEQAYFAIAEIYIKTNKEDKAVEILEQAQANIQTDALSARLDEVRKQALAAKEAWQEGGSAGQNNKGTAPAQTQALAVAPTPPTQAAAQSTPPMEPQPGISGITPAAAGEIITFGMYEQDNNTANGSEPIEWIVLDNQGDRMLVISRYGLDYKIYNETGEAVTWETCTLRSWLNSEFYNTAFNDSEKASIRTTTLNNPDSPSFGTIGGNTTADNVFCLSIDEAEVYFGAYDSRRDNQSISTKATAYAVARGAWVIDSTQLYGGNCWWGLRSPGYYQGSAALIDCRGRADDDANYNRNVNTAIRPALWIGI